MSALANFVMKGRAQAILVAVLATLVPLLFWISGAVVGLVTMRKGLNEGALVLVFALIAPALWAANMSEPTPLLVILLAWVMALVLRATVSWDKTLMVGSALVFGLGYILPIADAQLIDQLVQLGTEVLQKLNPEYITALGDDAQQVIRGIMVGSICVSLYMFALISLSLARSWQAKLYNPGGFSKEFWSLRLSARSCFVLMFIMAMTSSLHFMAVETILIAMVPLSFAGLALVHGVVAKKNLSKGWLVAFYVAGFVLGPSLMLLVVILAVVDALIDIRGRMQATGK